MRLPWGPGRAFPRSQRLMDAIVVSSFSAISAWVHPWDKRASINLSFGIVHPQKKWVRTKLGTNLCPAVVSDAALVDNIFESGRAMVRDFPPRLSSDLMNDSSLTHMCPGGKCPPILCTQYGLFALEFVAFLPEMAAHAKSMSIDP
jgi:hypothetical protein